MQIVPIATQVFSILTVIAQIVVIFLLVTFLIKNKTTQKIRSLIGNHAILFAFVVALVCMLGSLFYSEIAHFTPCKLCWYQRILMYPQVLLLGLAYAKKDKHIAIYSILLSSLGAVIAFYHYLIQIGTIGEILPCTAVGYSVSCAEKFVMTYGYITIPMMSLTGFILILFLFLTQINARKVK
jgi:disulfide bond formation protein DsbB